eukprot:g70798.t1
MRFAVLLLADAIFVSTLLLHQLCIIFPRVITVETSAVHHFFKSHDGREIRGKGVRRAFSRRSQCIHKAFDLTVGNACLLRALLLHYSFDWFSSV